MPTVCAIIRTADVNAEAKRLAGELAPVFGEDIYFVSDRYKDLDAPELLVKGKTIFVGRKFLSKRGLPWFPRVGWQCGDFAYYAAAAVLTKFDYYFVVEDDVSFRYEDKSFFERIFDFDFDIALYGMGLASDKWEWSKSMAGYYDIAVRHAFFPVSCVSRRAASYLLHERIKYSGNFKSLDWREVNFEYANDEVFVATASIHAGFRCQNIAELFPDSVWERFGLFWPIHPDEVAFFQQSILHPVCSGIKARKRFDFLMRDFDKNILKLRQRFEEYSRHLGGERWQEFTGIEKRFVAEGDNNPLIELFSLQTLVANRIKDKTSLPCNTWVHEKRISVFDVEIAGVTIAFDVSFSPRLMAHQIEVFGRGPAANEMLAKLNGGEVPKAKIVVGTVSEGLVRASKADEIAKVILESISAILD